MMTRFLRMLPALGALVLLVLLPSCAKKSENTIDVGVILPLSGDLAAFGTSTLEGVELRVKEINAAGGIGGKQIVLHTENNNNDQNQTISAYKKLTGLTHVSAVIGPITSTNTLALRDDATAAKTPTISPTATNEAVAPGSPYIFRTCFTDDFQGKVIATYAYNELGKRKAAVLIDKASDYAIGLSKTFKASFTALGGEIVAEETYKPKDTEFGPQLSKIKAAGADLVFLPGYPGEVPLIIKQKQVMGIKAVFCGSDGWDHDDIITKSGEGILDGFFTSGFYREDPRPEVKAFVAAIEAAGSKADFFSAQGYDTASILAKAMENGTDTESITQGLLALKNVPAVTGTITITPEGNAHKSAAILGIEKSGDTYVRKFLKSVNP